MRNIYTKSSTKTQEDSAQNRAERRRERSQWERRMRALHEDAGGAFGATVVRLREDLPRPPILLLNCIRQWTLAVLSKHVDPLCLTCDNGVGLGPHPPAAFVITIPLRDDPSIMCTSAVCLECATRHTDEELTAVVAKQFGGKIVPVSHMPPTSGRA